MINLHARRRCIGVAKWKQQRKPRGFRGHQHQFDSGQSASLLNRMFGQACKWQQVIRGICCFSIRLPPPLKNWDDHRYWWICKFREGEQISRIFKAAYKYRTVFIFWFLHFHRYTDISLIIIFNFIDKI